MNDDECGDEVWLARVGRSELVSATNALAKRGLDLVETIEAETIVEVRCRLADAARALGAARLAWRDWRSDRYAEDDWVFESVYHNCLNCYRHGLIAAATLLGEEWADCEPIDLARKLVERRDAAGRPALDLDLDSLQLLVERDHRPHGAGEEWRTRYADAGRFVDRYYDQSLLLVVAEDFVASVTALISDSPRNELLRSSGVATERSTPET